MWTKEKTVQKQYSSRSCRSRERRKRIVKQQLALTKKKTLVRVNLTKFWPCPPNKVNVCLSVCLRDLCLSFLFYMWACYEGSERVGGNVGTEGQKSSEWTIPFSFGKERREMNGITISCHTCCGETSLPSLCFPAIVCRSYSQK